MSYRLTKGGFDEPALIKVKRFACKSLKGRGPNTGLRIIYAYFERRQLIPFLEVYFNADQEALLITIPTHQIMSSTATDCGDSATLQVISNV